MASIEENESSYDAGGKPFRYDAKRGKWSAPEDFFFACVSHTFSSTHFSYLFVYLYTYTGVYGIIPLFITMIAFNIPMFFFQSFLGQFSSTGYISAFRIVPIMKGMGYAILLLNLISMTYGSILTAVPLLYILNSFRQKLPWMYCDNSYNTENCELLNVLNVTQDNVVYFDSSMSSNEFYENFIHVLGSETNFGFSWPVFICVFVVWGLALLCLRQNVEWIGKLLRWLCSVMFILLSIIVIRALFLLPIKGQEIYRKLMPNVLEFDLENILQLPLAVLLSTGAGWGNVLSLASHNHFKTDIHYWSWTVCITIIIVNILSGISIGIINLYASRTLNIYSSWNNRQPLRYVFGFVSIVLGSLKFPNLWTLVFYTLIFIGEMCTILVQLHSATTAICDEFENLREIRFEVTVVLTGILMIISTLFCFNHNFKIFGYLTKAESLPKLLLCLLMILLILWVYGRVRFQRDVQFMIGKTFSNCRVFVVRFITPFFIAFAMFFTVFELFALSFYSSKHEDQNEILTTIFTHSTYFGVILIYMIVKFVQITGSMNIRLRRLFRVIDWHPADSIDRQRYEDALGTSNISHQLVEMEINLEDVDGYDY